MKKIIVLLILCISLVGCSSKEIASGKISCSTKNLLMNEKSILIDVRSEEEYLEGHLDGAINIPYDVIYSEIDNYNYSKDTKIIVYCASGKRSNLAFNSLKQKGFANVYDLGPINSCK